MGFEVVVRPSVLPNIRPSGPRAVAPPDDPTKGLAVLTGGGGRFIGTSTSWSVSVSKQLPQEEEVRQFNKERVYQVDKQGNINKSNYVELERLTKVKLTNEQGSQKVIYADPPKADNVEVIERDLTRTNENK